MTKKNATSLFAAAVSLGVLALCAEAFAQTTVATEETAITGAGAVVHSSSTTSTQAVGTVETRPTTVQSNSTLANDEAIAHGTTGASTNASDPGTGSGTTREEAVIISPAPATATSVTTERVPVATAVETEATTTTTVTDER